jgi:excisionase family DNA binding protein
LSESRAEIDTEALLRKPIWTVEELAAFLSIPIKTIYVQRAKGDLCAGYRIGRVLRFKRDDVLRWLETKRDEA